MVTVLSLFLPYLTLLSASFLRSWGRGLAWNNITLEQFQWILITHQTTRGAIFNTFLFSTAAACAATGLALMTAYLTNRRLIKGGAILSNLAMAPYVIPGIVLAIGFVAAYARPPLFLYGTAWILILAFTTRFLPIAFTSIDSSLKSVHVELEEAARIGGAGQLTTLQKITLPLIKGGVLGGWLLILIAAMRELATAIFLFTADTKVMSIVLIDLSEEGDLERVSALAVVMLAVIISLVWASYRSLGRRFAWQRGG